MRLNLGPKIGVKRPSVEAAGRVKLANVTGPRPQTGWGVGVQRLAPAEFAPPIDVWSREAAMSVPTISRARDLLCSAVASLPITSWKLDFSLPDPAETKLPPATWMLRPDPNKTRQYTLSWTADDLIFNGRSYWHIVSRYATGFPSAFEWWPSTDVNVGSTGIVTHNGQEVEPNDLVEFLSPNDGLLFIGWRAIQTAVNLDNAAERFSTVELPAGWLEQTPDSEPLDATELAEIASDFATARSSRTVAALNPFLRWKESTIDPDRLQLTEARAHQALELSRLANIPPYLTGAPAGTSMTYSNSVQAKSDLIDFGALPLIACIEQTLSANNVTPQGQFVRLDVNAWLRNPFTNAKPSQNDAELAVNRGPGRPRDFDGQNEGVPQ